MLIIYGLIFCDCSLHNEKPATGKPRPNEIESSGVTWISEDSQRASFLKQNPTDEVRPLTGCKTGRRNSPHRGSSSKYYSKFPGGPKSIRYPVRCSMRLKRLNFRIRARTPRSCESQSGISPARGHANAKNGGRGTTEKRNRSQRATRTRPAVAIEMSSNQREATIAAARKPVTTVGPVTAHNGGTNGARSRTSTEANANVRTTDYRTSDSRSLESSSYDKGASEVNPRRRNRRLQYNYDAVPSERIL